MDKVLTKADINVADDIQVKEVKVPEWGGSVFIRTMTGNEQDDYESSVYANKMTKGKFLACLCSKTICDEKGNRLYSDDPGEIESLGHRSAAALSRIFKASLKLNRIPQSEIDELEKNSVSGLGADSPIS
jgi:hypothetical protein